MKNLQTWNEFLLEKNSSVLNTVLNGSYFEVKWGNIEHGTRELSVSKVTSMIYELIDNIFFDSEFFQNNPTVQVDYKKWYSKNIREVIFNDLDKFYKKYIDDKGGIWSVKKGIKSTEEIKNYFLNNKTIPEKLRKEWNLFQWSKKGEKPDPMRYEYIGEYPNKQIKEK